MKADKPTPEISGRFRELVRVLIEEELSPGERAEMKRVLKQSAEARSYLAEALAESTLQSVRGRTLKRESVRLSS